MTSRTFFRTTAVLTVCFLFFSPVLFSQTASDSDRPVLAFDPSAASVTMQAGEAPQKVPLRVKNAGGGTLNFQARSGMPWLKVSPAGGASRGEEVPVEIEVSSKDLQAGQYVGVVTLEDPNAANSPQTFRINFTLIPPPVMELGTRTLSAKVKAGKEQAGEGFSVINSGGGVLSYEVQSTAPWLQLQPAKGQVPAGTAVTVIPRYSTKDLEAGDHSATVTFASNGYNGPQTLNVALTVLGDKTFSIAAKELKLSAGGAGAEQIFRIENTSEGKAAFSVKSTAPWIKVMPENGEIGAGGTSVVTVTADPSKAGAETDAAVVVTDPATGEEYKIPVAAERKPGFKISPAALDISIQQGKKAPLQVFDIQNTGGDILKFKVQPGAKWISVQPAEGSLDPKKATRISVQCDTSGVSPGKKESEIAISGENIEGGPQKLKVSVTVNKKPSGKKTQLPQSDPKTGMVELAGGLWEKPLLGTDKSQYGKNIVPGSLKGLVLPIGDTDKQYWTETKADSDVNYDEVVLSYARELHLLDQGAPKSYTPSRRTVWQMNCRIRLYSPRAQWGGHGEYAFVNEKRHLVSQEKDGAAPQREVSGADKSYVTRKTSEKYGPDKGERWMFVALKNGAVIDLEASTYCDTVKHFGIEPNFYPWAEQLVKELSAKKWQSIFRQGNEKYDKLPGFMKPLVINIGLLSADAIILRQVGTPDWASLSLTYWTNTYEPDTSVYGLHARVTVAFYAPYNEGEKMAKFIIQSELDRPQSTETYTKVSFGDGGFKRVNKEHPTNLAYIVRVGSAIVDVNYSSSYGYDKYLNPPTDLVEEIVEKVRAIDPNAVTAYVGGSEAEEEYVEEELSDEVFEEEPEEEALPENFWDPGYDPSIGGTRVALPETPGQPPIDPATYQPQPGDKSTNGLVWSGTYGDWVRPDVYDNEQQQRKLGRVWQGDLRGWETPSETKERNKDLEKFIAGNESADAEERKKLKELTDAIQQARDNLKKLKEKAARREELLKKLEQLEKEQSQAERDAKWYSSAVMKETRNRIAREVVTGQTAEGAISFKAIGLRMIAGVVSGGYSEIVYGTADGCYRTYDNLLKGDSIMMAVGKAVATVAAEEAFGRVVLGVAPYIGKKVSQMGRKLMGEAAEQGAGRLPGKLVAKKAAVAEALKETKAMKETAAFRTRYKVNAAEDVDFLLKKGRVSPKQAESLKKAIAEEAEQTKKILELYKKNGMKDLSELERAGHLSPNQAKKLNEVVSREVNDAVDKGVKKNMARFEEKTGVKVREVLVGDSGSSAGRRARSIKTDADRTLVVDFDPVSLRKYAKKYHNGNVAEAYDQLSKKFVKNQDTMVGLELRAKGVTRKNVDYKTYDRFGKPGMDDSYPATYVKTLQATKGQTTVYRKAASGEVRSVKTSGQAIVDKDALINKRINRVAVEEGPKISRSESGALMAQQKQALAKQGVTAEKAGKALERADKALALAEKARIDPELLKKAKLIRENPQQVKQILGGQSEEAFVKELEAAVSQSST